MQRKKMLIAVLAIALLLGIVSAATISYFGQIKVTTTVSQAVLVDGKSYADMPIEETTTVAGGQSFCRPHWLKSQTSVPVELQFDTTFSPELTDDEINVTYSTQITDNNTNFGSGDNEVVAFPTSGLTLNALFAGVGLKYTYTVLAGDGAPPIVAVLDLIGGRHIVLFPGWGARTGTHTLQFSDSIAYDTGGNHLVDFVVYDSDFHKIWGSPGSYPAYNDIKTSSGCPIIGTETVTRVAIQHQGANTGETDRLDSLAFGVTTYSFAITEGTQFTLQPLQKLHFVICYKFDLLIQGGTYYIYTTVKPSL